jgi:hypothetical protein
MTTKRMWEENPFHELHFANENLWLIAQALNGKPWDAEAAHRVADILKNIGYKIEAKANDMNNFYAG